MNLVPFKVEGKEIKMFLIELNIFNQTNQILIFQPL